MSMFPEANNVLISNGTFSDHSHTIGVQFNLGSPIMSPVETSAQGIKALLAASLPDAAYNSSARDPPRCFPGTREQYIKDVTHWALSSSPSDNNASSGNNPLIFWMKGPAGVGKSALAQTSTEKVEAAGKLGAAFFFSASSGRNKPKKFFTTLAYQISMNFRTYRDLLDAKIRDDETLVSKSLVWQFEELIARPFQELKNRGQPIEERVIFVDGLDECFGTAAQCEIIEIVAASVRNRSTPFRWAFFSRPEPHIEATFSRAEISAHCLRVTLPISRQVDGEIRDYLRNGLHGILQRHNISKPDQWPSEKDLTTLVDAAAGLFIYAATVLRFIGQAGSLDPEGLLRTVLSVITNTHRQPNNDASKEGSNVPPNPFVELDAFYSLIMHRIPSTVLPSVQSLLLLLSIADTSSTRYECCAMQLGNLLGFSEIQFIAICHKLHAVIEFSDHQRRVISHNRSKFPPGVNCSNHLRIEEGGLGPFTPKMGGGIAFYHKSFADFLADTGRSGAFCVRTERVANELFARCLKRQFEYVRSYYFEETELQSLLLPSDTLPPWEIVKPRLTFLPLAPGVPNSSSSLTWSYKDECLNAFLKVHVYRFAIETALQLHLTFNLDQESLKLFEEVDYRKMLRIFSTGDFELQLTSALNLASFPDLEMDSKVQSRDGFYPSGAAASGEHERLFGAVLRRLPKELRLRHKIVRPYTPNLLSKCRSFVRGGLLAGGGVLYMIGRGEGKLYLCRSGFTEYLAANPFHSSS